MRMNAEMFKRYVKNPLGVDDEVRAKFNLPEDKYYSVSVWPEEREGFVWVTLNVARKTPVRKISKSDQK